MENTSRYVTNNIKTSDQRDHTANLIMKPFHKYNNVRGTVCVHLFGLPYAHDVDKVPSTLAHRPASANGGALVVARYLRILGSCSCCAHHSARIFDKWARHV